MSRKPTKGAPAPPDGEPKVSRDKSSKTSVSDVQDPLIPGDSGSRQKRREANEASVDEAGQITRKQPSVDLLH